LVAKEADPALLKKRERQKRTQGKTSNRRNRPGEEPSEQIVMYALYSVLEALGFRVYKGFSSASLASDGDLYSEFEPLQALLVPPQGLETHLCVCIHA
jgi:hypothetical protein